MLKKEQILQQYKKDVINLVESAKEFNSRNKQKLFSECFNLLKNKDVNLSKEHKTIKNSTFLKKIFKLFSLIFSFAIFAYILLNVHQPTSSLVLRNVQGFIYPGLKFLRFLSVPVIQRFPLLTGNTYIQNFTWYLNWYISRILWWKLPHWKPSFLCPWNGVLALC